MKLAIRFLCAFLISFVISLPVLSQDNQAIGQQLLEIADDIYTNTQALIPARDAYLQVLDYDPDHLKANYMAGKLYLLTNNKERATQYLLKVYEQDPDYAFDLLYRIGRAYQYNLDFDNAIRFFEDYLDKLSNAGDYRGEDRVPSADVKKRIEHCENGKDFIANPLNYDIANIGAAVNSEWPDYAPVVNRDETILIFTSRRQEGNLNPDVFEDNFPYEDIFISTKAEGEWGPAGNIGDFINTPYFESSLAISPDNKTGYFYYDENGGDIYYSIRNENGEWTDTQPMLEPINSPFKESSLTISPDGEMIIFSSNRPNAIGGSDLFYSIKDRRGRWVTADNLGDVINTEYDEDFPFIDYDGKTLYFSSQGHKGMGGFDVFKSMYDSITGSWLPPVNVGYPINTPDHDISFITSSNGKRGYYSSAKDDSYGYEDIYEFTIPEEVLAVDFTKQQIVVEKRPETSMKPVKVLIEVVSGTNDPMTANVKLRDDTENMLIPVRSQAKGIYVAYVDNSNSHKHHVSAESDGYIFVNKPIDIPVPATKDQTMQVRLVLNPIKTGSSKVLRNIYFDFDKAVLKEESHVEMNKLYQMLQENNRLIAEIAGHTDNTGGRNYNQRLSYLRAKAVNDYLIKKGIDPKRIQPVGYGEERPIASNDDEKNGRELNRRVELKVYRYLY